MKKINAILILMVVGMALAGCHKDKGTEVKDPMVTDVELTVSRTQARFSWSVDFTGQFQAGVDLSQSESMTDFRRVEATKQDEKYVAVVNGLSLGTKYYYRIVVWNTFKSYEQPLGEFTTAQAYTVTLSCLPEEGGVATGGGSYCEGDTCTVTATANTGYNFVNWTENGTQVSTEMEYTFPVITDRNLVANFAALPPDEYVVSVSASPSEGGTVTGGGIYQDGEICTLTATASAGYNFVNWTENGTQVSTEMEYTFPVTGDRTLVANFTLQAYTITVIVGPTEAGMVTGSGDYHYGEECTLTATAHEGYAFMYWVEDGNVISTETSYIFVVTGDRTLVANFTVQPQSPIGTINGLFTINSNGNQVYFSQGNLQYIGSASTPYWRFADNQWEYLDITTGQNSNYENVDRDLFGWGTSGYHIAGDANNVNYQPYSTSKTVVNTTLNYYGYGPSTNMPSPNLTGSSANYDWGVYNPISNGGNAPNQWRTLTGNEWHYVFTSRNTSSGMRFVKAQIVGTSQGTINGVILLPDDWSASYYPLINPDQNGVGFSSNMINVSTWINSLEAHGAVFLPAAGSRNGIFVSNAGSNGYYWSASYGNSINAYSVSFGDTSCLPQTSSNRFSGCSVRLVRPAGN